MFFKGKTNLTNTEEQVGNICDILGLPVKHDNTLLLLDICLQFQYKVINEKKNSFPRTLYIYYIIIHLVYCWYKWKGTVELITTQVSRT